MLLCSSSSANGFSKGFFSLSTEAFPQYRWTRMDPDNRQIVLFRHQTTKFCQKSPNCSFFAKFKKPSLLRGRRNLKNLRCWEEEEKPSILRGRKNTPTKNKVLNLENIQNPNECARAYMEPPYRWYWFFIKMHVLYGPDHLSISKIDFLDKTF